AFSYVEKLGKGSREKLEGSVLKKLIALNTHGNKEFSYTDFVRLQKDLSGIKDNFASPLIKDQANTASVLGDIWKRDPWLFSGDNTLNRVSPPSTIAQNPEGSARQKANNFLVRMFATLVAGDPLLPVNKVVANALRHKRDIELLDVNGLLKTIIEEPSFKTLPRHNQNIITSMAKKWKEITQSEAYKANFIRSFFANKKEAVKNTQKEASKDLAQSN
ncbi:hypothetical protein, partial [Helicobacter sp. 11S02629-2]|uniref:hypothetical protein n=1 Tax=Helicobacter sp. 11S02629-2 TaxID=1476195 RepID=UPI0015DB0D67